MGPESGTPVGLRQEIIWEGLQSAILTHTVDEIAVLRAKSDVSEWALHVPVQHRIAARIKVARCGPVSTPFCLEFRPRWLLVYIFPVWDEAGLVDIGRRTLTELVADLTEAPGDSTVWLAQYSVFPGWHGSDLLAAFFSTSFTADTSSFLDDVAMLMVPALAPFAAGISSALQSYVASFVTTGDPNTNHAMWNLPSSVN